MQDAELKQVVSRNSKPINPKARCKHARNRFEIKFLGVLEFA